jgi:hypothetical protein
LDEHPLWRMWHDRLQQELEQQSARDARRADRVAVRVGWYVAWEQYKARVHTDERAERRPRWWNVPGWLLWLLRLHAPGGPH